ncbi:hypothetical protein C6A36_00625, partial [Desulfobacteraceae bacterium SEEP-SAG10]
MEKVDTFQQKLKEDINSIRSKIIFEDLSSKLLHLHRSLIKAKKLLDDYVNNSDRRNLSKSFTYLMLFPVIPFFIYIIDRYLRGFPSWSKLVISIFAGFLFCMTIHMAQTFYHKYKKKKLKNLFRLRKKGLLKILQSKINQHMINVKNLSRLRQFMEVRFLLSRIYGRVRRTQKFTTPPLGNESSWQLYINYHQYVHERLPTPFFSYIMNTDSLDNEYNNFIKSHIHKDESYASINPEHRSKGVVKQVLSPIFYSLRRIEYDSVFHKILKDICADLQVITNKKNMMDFVTPQIVQNRFETLIPRIANPPTGMFLDSSRGGHQPDVFKKFPLICEENTANHFNINHIAFS